MFLGELVVWKNFIRSLKALTKPFINLTVTMYSLLLLYSAIGGHLFGGVINTNSIVTIVANSDGLVDPSWVYLNFNDSIMSINTLFSFIWLNGWEQMLFMYQLAFNHDEDGRIILFFVSFFSMAQYIILNILVAFVIDVYSSIKETMEEEDEQLKMKIKVEKALKGKKKDRKKKMERMGSFLLAKPVKVSFDPEQEKKESDDEKAKKEAKKIANKEEKERLKAEKAEKARIKKAKEDRLENIHKNESLLKLLNDNPKQF